MNTIPTELSQRLELPVNAQDTLQIKPPVKAALNLLIARNRKVNTSHPELHLTVEPTPTLVVTAERLVDFQGKLKRIAGDSIAYEFLSTPYNITWLEQLLDIDPQKVALAMQTKHRVHDMIQKQGMDPQYEPVLALGVFAGLERIYDLEAANDNTTTVIEKIHGYDMQSSRKNRLHSHLVRYLETLPNDRPILVGQQRDEALTQIIAQDIAKRLETHSHHAAILKQSQGIEIEVLQHLDWIEEPQRDTRRKKLQMNRVEKYGIRNWLPRGIRKENHERMDWHLTHMLGIPEDISEKKFEYFEMSTAPTEGGPAQSTILYELMLAGFITPEELSNTWEKYSMHAATTFPETIWHDKAQKQYVLHARALAGAFASAQRGVYGGYVFDDTVGREIADKTIQGEKKFKAVEGRSADTKLGQRLVEMRVLDLTEQGQYAIELHKPYLDFAFRCYWEFTNGQPLRNVAEYRAVNSWTKYVDELSAIYNRYDISMDTSSNNWRAVGWKKAENPQLQKDLATLIRTHARELRHVVDAELTNSEPLPEKTGLPITILDKHLFTRIETVDNPLQDPIVVLTQEQANQLGFKDKQIFFMRFGEIKKPIFIHIDKTGTQQQSTFGVNAELAHLFHLPENTRLSIRYNPIEKELACGPIIGITRRIEDESLQNPFGEQTLYFKSVIQAAKKIGAAGYIFDISEGIDNINNSNKTITGVSLDETGEKWIRTTMPYPDVIFSRALGLKSEKKLATLAHIPQVNNSKFSDFLANKVELPEALCRSPILRDHIPETVTYSGLHDIEEMLKHHDTVYLKPKWGMRSEGVARFDKLPNGNIRYTLPIRGTDPLDTSYSWPEPHELGYGGYEVPSVHDALKATEAFRKQFSSYQTYVLQEGIPGIPSHEGNRPFELRFLFQRNPDGKFGIIGWDQGQKTYWMPVIKRLFGVNNAEAVATNAINLATAVSLQVQSQFGSNFGQYSVQIAVDGTGKTWFLEANPKPGVSNQFHYLHLDKVIDYSAEQTVKLCESMSGFAEKSSETQKIKRVTLKDGSTGVISEETNPYIIYQFALNALGENILQKEKSVYNLQSIDRIKQNIAYRTRYYVLRDEAGKILGCRSILWPKTQKLINLDLPNHPLEDTRMRWEIGGGLTSPEARGKGVTTEMFRILIEQIQNMAPVKDEHNKKDVDEILVNISGTRDPNKLGIARDDSVGSERVVQRLPGSRRIGAVPGSYGPIYVFPITPKTQ